MPSPMIHIPPDDPFANDMLNREETIRAHTTRLLARHPQTIAIDAGWGQGKSVFMDLWAAHLLQQAVTVVQFNAWRHSTSHPIYAITAGILNVLQDQPTEPGAKAYRRLRRFLKDNRYKIQTGITAFEMLPQGSLITGPLKAVIDCVTQNKIVTFPDDFRRTLSELAEQQINPPLVILVDELDRCSPGYAVKMLQTLEHIFLTPNIVFAVAINRDQLAHSMRRFYGDHFDADNYLERFFDNVYQLPSTLRPQFIERSLECALRLIRYDHEITEQKPPIFLGPHTQDPYKWERFTIEQHIRGISSYLNDSDLSIRQIRKATAQLESILADDRITPHIQHTTMLLWLLRTIHPIAYAQFSRGNISDKEFIEVIYQDPAFQEHRSDTNSDRSETSMWIEAVLIHLSSEIGRNRSPSYQRHQQSSLAVFHRDNQSASSKTEVPSEYSRKLVELIQSTRAAFSPGIDPDAPAQAAVILENSALLPEDRIQT